MASVLDEAVNSQNRTGQWHSEALAFMLSVGRELKMEVPANLVLCPLSLERNGCPVTTDKGFPTTHNSQRTPDDGPGKV